MIIRNFSIELCDEGRKRAAAEILWEDCGRQVDRVFFEVDRDHHDRLALNPNAFLLAAFIPAIKNRERRIRVEGSICPELSLGIQRVAAIIQHWHYPGIQGGIVLESEPEAPPLWKCADNRKSGFFFSGGIDSLATLLRNHAVFKPGNCSRVAYGITVYGLEMDKIEQLGPVEKRLERIAQAAGIERFTLRTNVRILDENWQFWEYQWQGSVLASIAHALASTIDRAFIGSTIDYRYLKPYGSHPLIDPALSSSHMRIVHDGLTMNRLEKVRLVSQYEYALDNMRCCNQTQKYDDDYVNCGKCEKCLRTMLALHALGRLAEAKCFRDPSVNAGKVESLNPLTATSKIWWREFAGFLNQSDDPRLFEAVNTKVFGSPEKIKRRNRLRRLKNAIDAVDEKLLGGRLRRVKSAIDQI